VLAQKTGEFDQAVKEYLRAAELEPSDVAYLLLSQALQQSGQAAASQAALEAAKRVSPDFERAQQAVRDLQAE
jgi:tetratricopeptide (TPR) repeat protein